MLALNYLRSVLITFPEAVISKLHFTAKFHYCLMHVLQRHQLLKSGCLTITNSIAQLFFCSRKNLAAFILKRYQLQKSGVSNLFQFGSLVALSGLCRNVDPVDRFN